MILQRDFYLQSPMDAAVALVGAWLCRQMPDGKFIRARICELELYLDNDRACHALHHVMTQCLWRVGMHTCICAMDYIIC